MTSRFQNDGFHQTIKIKRLAGSFDKATVATAAGSIGNTIKLGMAAGINDDMSSVTRFRTRIQNGSFSDGRARRDRGGLRSKIGATHLDSATLSGFISNADFS